MDLGEERGIMKQYFMGFMGVEELSCLGTVSLSKAHRWIFLEGVLVHFVATWHKLELLEKQETQLRKCLLRICP